MVKAADIDRVISGHSAVMDAYDPRRKVGLVLRRVGHLVGRRAGHEPGFLYQQNTMRDALVASLHFDIFHRHADRLRDGEHRADRQRAAGDDPHRRRRRARADPDLPRVRDEQGPPGRAACRCTWSRSRRVRWATSDDVSVSASTKDGKALVSMSNLALDTDTTVRLDLRGRAVTGARPGSSPPTSRRATTRRPRPRRWFRCRWKWPWTTGSCPRCFPRTPSPR